MEERLHERIIGQDEAIRAIADAIRRARSGLKDPRRPIGSFIFIGPSGVGKTELAKALAWFLFDDEDALVRIDMSEYREQHTVSRLFGAPPGYVGYEEGGQLTEAVRRRPYRVLLFDEIEKAHPEVWNALLQILDDGRMTDGQGNVVDFRNTVIIMTSNLGTEFVRKGGTLGFLPRTEDREEREAHEKIERALKNTFRPEFLNRIDEIIIFSPLSPADMERIVDLQIKEVQQRLEDYDIRIELTPAARAWLARIGYDPAFGARPLRRAIQKHLESPLSVPAAQRCAAFQHHHPRRRGRGTAEAHLSNRQRAGHGRIGERHGLKLSGGTRKRAWMQSGTGFNNLSLFHTGRSTVRRLSGRARAKARCYDTAG